MTSETREIVKILLDALRKIDALQVPEPEARELVVGAMDLLYK